MLSCFHAGLNQRNWKNCLVMFKKIFSNFLKKPPTKTQPNHTLRRTLLPIAHHSFNPIINIGCRIPYSEMHHSWTLNGLSFCLGKAKGVLLESLNCIHTCFKDLLEKHKRVYYKWNPDLILKLRTASAYCLSMKNENQVWRKFEENRYFL